VTLEAARKAGLIGRRRVLDSTPLYDAVATMGTVTLIRSGIRGLLKVAGAELGAQLRSVIRRGDDYTAAGKPVCDYDDAMARKVLGDALAKDAIALLGVLDGRKLDGPANRLSSMSDRIPWLTKRPVCPPRHRRQPLTGAIARRPRAVVPWSGRDFVSYYCANSRTIVRLRNGLQPTNSRCDADPRRSGAARAGENDTADDPPTGG